MGSGISEPMRIASFRVAHFLGLGLCLTSILTLACGTGGPDTGDATVDARSIRDGASDARLGCKSPSTAEQACLTCENSSCSAYVTSTASACPGYLSCLAACTCGSPSCQDGCLSQVVDAGTACENALEYLGTCTSSCKPCEATGSNDT
jgi:hypothetical protein